MKIILTLSLLLAACVADRPSAPAVRLITTLTDSVVGVSAWEPLGFDVSANDSELPECAYTWYRTKTTSCQITIGIVIDPLLREHTGTLALSYRDQRTIVLDDDIREREALLVAVAHESGHILLDTPKHTSRGIMGGTSWHMWDEDRTLACETIDICIEP